MQRSSLLLPILCYLSCSQMYGQEVADNSLLQQAEKEAYTNPIQALNIVEFALNEGPSIYKPAEVWLIAAKAHNAMGQYDKSIKSAFQSFAYINNADYAKSSADTEIFLAYALYDLGLGSAVEFLPSFHISYFDSTQLNEVRIIQALIEAQRRDDAEGKLAALWKAVRIKNQGKATQTLTAYDPHLALGEYYLSENEPDSALVYINAALQSTQSLPKGHHLGVRFAIGMAQVRFLKKNYTDAVNILNGSLNSALNLQNSAFQYSIYSQLAENHIALGNLKEFESNLQNASAIDPQLERIRNEALNAAHKGFQDVQKINIESQEVHWLWQRQYGLAALFALMGLAFGIYFITSLRIRNKRQWLLYSTDLTAEMKHKEMKKAKPTTATAKQLTINEDTEQVILDKLVQFEKGKRFLKKDMSLAQLSSHLGTNTKYLSEIINRHKGKNFNLYINELRVQYIIEKLRSNPTYLNYKVSYLANESGFASHSSFTTVFKSITGVSPARYIDILRKEEQ